MLDIYLPKNASVEKADTLSGIYMVFEYIPFTLSSILYEFNNCQSKQLIKIITYNFLCCMKFIHSCNLVHRDLKPSNILLTPSSEVKVADFGLSRTICASKSEKRGKLVRSMSSSCFTRFYRPPEVILENDAYD